MGVLRLHPHLYEIHTWAWLEELSERLGRTISLGEVPESEWDEISALGFDIVWLMGIWQRSPAGRRYFQTDAASFPSFDNALPAWKLSQITGSPYSVRRYQPDPRMGTWKDLDGIREKLRERRIRLILDFVPNHTAPDHPWTRKHPEYYVRGSEENFRKDPSAFYLLETDAEPRLFAHGRDPYFPPWRDVVQINYFKPSARKAMLAALRKIAEHCDGVRCDMAMLVFNDIFARTWSSLLSDFTPPSEEFWSEAIAAVPNFLWLAEVYWNCEARCQQLGFQFTYDKGLYDALRDGRVMEIHERLRAELPQQARAARFLENHDELRSAVVFGAAKREAFGTLVATLPGMRFYHYGQLDGRKIHLPMPLGVAAREKPDAETRAFYERILRLSNHPVFHEGQWRLLEVHAAGDGSFSNVVAYEWFTKNTLRVVVVNLAGEISQARIGFGPEILPTREYEFTDQLHDVPYLRDGEEIAHLGLYVRLDAYRAHLFDVSSK